MLIQCEPLACFSATSGIFMCCLLRYCIYLVLVAITAEKPFARGCLKHAS